MQINTSASKYQGIYYMLIAALSFSVMSGFAKILKGTFQTQELVFYRNVTGLIFLMLSFVRYPVQQTGGKFFLLLFRGLMGTIALYTLLFNILHIPLGTAMTYNTTNTLFIALLSFLFLKDKLNWVTVLCILVGFFGVLLIYKPSEVGIKFHLIGLTCGFTSALAYLSISSLNRFYDARVIVLSFILTGVLLPLFGALIYRAGMTGADGFFSGPIHLPQKWEWIYILAMGFSALLGQYFVTKSYSHDKAGIVSAIGYSNIIFALAIGLLLGDAFPDLLAITGIILVIISGVIITLSKK